MATTANQKAPSTTTGQQEPFPLWRKAAANYDAATLALVEGNRQLQETLHNSMLPKPTAVTLTHALDLPMLESPLHFTISEKGSRVFLEALKHCKTILWHLYQNPNDNMAEVILTLLKNCFDNDLKKATGDYINSTQSSSVNLFYGFIYKHQSVIADDDNKLGEIIEYLRALKKKSKKIVLDGGLLT